MKTRFSSLVTLKKSAMQKSEQLVQNANTDLKNAESALTTSYFSLENIESPQGGTMSQMLATRTLLSSQRNVILHNQEWVEFANKQLLSAQKVLKKDMIEHEKFKYLELEEIKKILKEIKVKEAKELDEIALITFSRNLKER